MMYQVECPFSNYGPKNHTYVILNSKTTYFFGLHGTGGGGGGGNTNICVDTEGAL